MRPIATNAEPTWISRMRWVSRIMAGVVVLLALLVLFGWWSGAAPLTELVAGRPKTVPNTALGLLFNGFAALWLHHGRGSRGWRLLASPTAAVLGSTLGVLTLVEYVFSVDLRIDRLMHELMGIEPSVEVRWPGRPSPQTALCLAFIGFALLVVGHGGRFRSRCTEVLATFAGFIALVQLTAHVYGAAALYRLSRAPATGMGLFTVLGMLLLVGSVLFIHPECGWLAPLLRRSPGGYMARRLVPLALCMPVAIGLGVAIVRLWGPYDIALAFSVMVVSTVPFAIVLCLMIAKVVDRAQEERKAAEDRLQDVIDLVPEGVVIADIERRLCSNRATLAFLSRKLEHWDAARYDKDLDFRRPSGEPVPWELFPLSRALSLGEQVRSEELVLRTQEGSSMAVLVNASPMRHGGAVAVLQDLSSSTPLERLREEWITVVMHDLRQPLSRILMATEVLRMSHKGALSKHEDALLSGIRSSVTLLSRMTEDLLEVSQVETNRLRLQYEDVDVPAFIHEIVDRGGELFEGHRVTVDVEGEVRRVQADPQRLTQILGNLLSNAVKYGSPGTEINVFVKGGERAIEIAVTNRGAGIREEEIKYLFSRYYRTESAKAGSKAGLGLGLYIVKGLVEAHGGQISVASVPDGETTFRFTLPLGALKEMGASVPATPPRPSGS